MKKNYITIMIGAKLRHFFEDQKMTQHEIASKLNTKQSWVSRIYDGEFGYRSRVARELCVLADIPFLDSPEISEESKNEEKVLLVAQKLVSLSNGDRNTIKQLSIILNQLK